MRNARTAVILLGLTLFAGVKASAQVGAEAADIARYHVEAIGGADRVRRLESYRAAGVARAGDQEMEVQLWAQRPNRVRIELSADGIVLSQGWDGENEPWVQAGRTNPAQAMPATMKQDFVIEAEFDDPLFEPERRGYVVDYAGEGEVAGRPVVKLVATRSASDQSTLYLAADSYFIVREDRVQRQLDGSRLASQTYYGDFRAVRGVILPHRMRVEAEGKVINDVVLHWMEGNPPLEDDWFAAPKVSAKAER